MSFLGLGDFTISSKVRRRAGLVPHTASAFRLHPGVRTLGTAVGGGRRGGSGGWELCSHPLPAELEWPPPESSQGVRKGAECWGEGQGKFCEHINILIQWEGFFLFFF